MKCDKKHNQPECQMSSKLRGKRKMTIETNYENGGITCETLYSFASTLRIKKNSYDIMGCHCLKCHFTSYSEKSFSFENNYKAEKVAKEKIPHQNNETCE